MSSYTLAVTPSVPVSDQNMREFDRALQALHHHTPLQFFHWDQRVSPVTTYDYQIKAAAPDLRTFTQVYDFADPGIAPAELPSFSSAGSKWSLVEIDLHRAVRAQLLLIVRAYGVTSLRATFT